jgi:hypothetical protein
VWREARLFTGNSSEADGGTRTPDPIITNDVLYQLSYVGARPGAGWTAGPAQAHGSDRSGA